MKVKCTYFSSVCTVAVLSQLLYIKRSIGITCLLYAYIYFCCVLITIHEDVNDDVINVVKIIIEAGNKENLITMEKCIAID